MFHRVGDAEHVQNVSQGASAQRKGISGDVQEMPHRYQGNDGSERFAISIACKDRSSQSLRWAAVPRQGFGWTNTKAEAKMVVMACAKRASAKSQALRRPEARSDHVEQRAAAGQTPPSLLLKETRIGLNVQLSGAPTVRTHLLLTVNATARSTAAGVTRVAA